MAIKTNLEQRQTIAPATIQYLSMLQMTRTELDTWLQEAAMENPLLDLSYQECIAAPRNDFIPRFIGTNNSDQESDIAAYLADRACRTADGTLADALKLQLLRDKRPIADCARLLIDLLDDRGYLSPADFTAVEKQFPDKAEQALDLLHSLSPAGVGARDLQECLLLQLERMDAPDPLVVAIVRQHLPDVAQSHYHSIAKALHTTQATVKAACRVIRSLNPYPGSEYAPPDSPQYVYPDCFLEDRQVRYNDSVSLKVQFNPYYLELAKTSDDPELLTYIKQKAEQARFVLDTMQQRETTLLHCVTEIVQFQKPFFESRGKAALRPLTQSQLAEICGLTHSTVSRAIRGKFIQTDFGCYPLSSFFANAVSPEQDFSASYIKDRIRAMVAAEAPGKPLSDQDICDTLKSEGVTISRRATAKYRTELGIPPSFARKCN